MLHQNTLKKKTILGVDPGLSSTGWGVIHLVSTQCLYEASGLIKTHEKEPIDRRLARLFDDLTHLFTVYQIDCVAIEEVFVNKNPKSSLKLAMARGITLCAPARLQIPVFSYTANCVKKAVVGYGHAEKNQVSWGVQQVLHLEIPPQKDAADALAVAICHAHTSCFS